MRQVFSSARLENVEAVAELLRKEGIEVRISDGRSYRGNRRSHFSYSETQTSGPMPAVWILNADDQPRGRQLLRDAGLLDSTRAGESSYLPLSTMHQATEAVTRKASTTRTRMRIGLLVLIVLVSALIWYARREPPAASAGRAASVVPAAPKHPAPAIVPRQADDLEVYRADVPTALAKLLIEREIAGSRPLLACISIDGADPSPQFIASLALQPATEAYAGSDCPERAALRIVVQDYTTDGSGRGQVRIQSGAGKPRSIEVERDGIRWGILPQR